MGGRVVDCARLESVYAARHPGFESPPIRQRFLFNATARSIGQTPNNGLGALQTRAAPQEATCC